MEPLATLRDKDVFPQNPSFEVTSWQERKTVKVIIEKNNRIALITNAIHHIYLLPGGGIDNGEEILTAADREAREEVGYSIRDSRLVGSTEEYRGRDKKHYFTYCVFAKADAMISDDLRTANEKELNLSVGWFDKNEITMIFKKQLDRLRNGEITFYNTGFNIMRDKLLFDFAMKKN